MTSTDRGSALAGTDDAPDDVWLMGSACLGNEVGETFACERGVCSPAP